MVLLTEFMDHDLTRGPLRITDANQIWKIEGLIHDEHFESDEIQLNNDGHILEIPFRRMFHDFGRIIREGFFKKVYEVELQRCSILIAGVQSFSVSDREEIGTYSFNTVSYSNGSIRLDCDPNFSLTVLVQYFEMEIRYLKDQGKAQISRGWWGDSYTGEVLK